MVAAYRGARTLTYSFDEACLSRVIFRFLELRRVTNPSMSELYSKCLWSCQGVPGLFT